jgi:MEMO1 family protein
MRVPAVVERRVTRAPVAAGKLYPDDPDALRRAVEELLARAGRRPRTGLRALVVPHGEYARSGAVAAAAFATAPRSASVVLLGPSRVVSLAGLTVSDAGAWTTPLGDVRVSARLRRRAIAAGARVDDVPHEHDDALEAQLPFLQQACEGGLEILPVAVGSCVPSDVVRLLDALDAFVVVSTNLSSDMLEEAATRRDDETVDTILHRETHGLRAGDVSGVFALRGIVEHARRHELEVELVERATALDPAGDPGRVTGYASFAISSRNPTG